MSTGPLHYVTLHGIPLGFQLDFPFRPSTSGADYFVLHGMVTLEDGSGLHAPVAVHMSQTVKEALPSVTAADALGPAINAIRKATDTKDIEFLKSDKRQPIPLSSRAFSIVTRKFTFQQPTDDQLFGYFKRSIFWRTRLGQAQVDLADPIETLYLSRTSEQLLESGKKLAAEGWITLQGNLATATAKLNADAAHFEMDMNKALDELNAKHAYERG